METVSSGAVSAPFYECRNSDVIIVIGANPAVNHPVAATFFKNAVRNGASLVVLDPRGQALSRACDPHAEVQAGGTDVALLNAMMCTIVQEGLVNREYVEQFTVRLCQTWKATFCGFCLRRWRSFVGIPAATIRSVARLLRQGVRERYHLLGNGRLPSMFMVPTMLVAW